MNKTKYTFSRKGLFAALIIIGILLGTQIIPTPTLNKKTWHIIWQGNLAQATEGNPGSGMSGFLEIYFINHTATPDTTYNRNTTSVLEGWANANLAASGSVNAWANADNFKCELKSSTSFDILIRARWNKTNAWDGSKFIGTNCRINITLTGFNVGSMSDIVGTGVITRNNTGDSYIWENWYWQDADGGTGTGFTINKGATWSANQITMIKIWAKY